MGTTSSKSSAASNVFMIPGCKSVDTETIVQAPEVDKETVVGNKGVDKETVVEKPEVDIETVVEKPEVDKATVVEKPEKVIPVSYRLLRAHETSLHPVCRLLL